MAVELTSILNLDKINVSGMDAPRPERLKVYEDYYLAEGRFANAVIVDECWNIRSGYMTYLLARKYGVRPPIFEIRASRPVRKVVRGRRMRYAAWEWKPIGARQEAWRYTLDEPVVPGDILRVETRKGSSNMQVESVDYMAEEECAHMRKTLKHIKKRKSVMESGT